MVILLKGTETAAYHDAPSTKARPMTNFRSNGSSQGALGTNGHWADNVDVGFRRFFSHRDKLFHIPPDFGYNVSMDSLQDSGMHHFLESCDIDLIARFV